MGLAGRCCRRADGLMAGLWPVDPFSGWVVSQPPVDRHSHLGNAMALFVHDTPKVLMLLGLVAFVVGYLRSYFSPERTRTIFAGKRAIWVVRWRRGRG